MAQKAKLYNDHDETATQYYDEIRSDAEETTWACWLYDGKTLGDPLKGTDYAEFLALLEDDKRGYAYVRFETGDEMSKRAKFAFITWIGPSVGPLQKAGVSTDKAFIKQLWPQFGKEILADDKKDIEAQKVRDILEKASGAHYGTGK